MKKLFKWLFLVTISSLLSACQTQETRIKENGYSNNSYEYLQADFKSIVRKIEVKYEAENTDVKSVERQWIGLLFNEIDRNREIFLEEQINKVHIENRDLYKLSHYDQLKRLDKIFDIAAINIQKIYSHIIIWLEAEPELSSNGLYNKSEYWMKSENEQLSKWKKKIYLDVMTQLAAGKSWSDVKYYMLKKWEHLSETYVKASPRDRFQLMMNAYLKVYDANASYFLPHKPIDLRKRLALVGTGMMLQSDNGYTKVVRNIKNGPADKTGKIKPGDIIIGIAQGESRFKPVYGMLLDDVVELMRGPKLSVVRLKIKRGAIEFNVPVVRNTVKLQGQRVSYLINSRVINRELKNIAIITIPKFYIDFEAYNRGDKNPLSSSNDVKKILSDIEKKNIHGVIIDLRGNGGGSLYDVTQSTSLFLDKNPVVQTKNRSGIKVYRNNNGVALYKGPLIVLVDENSAAASEIMAAAIQDINRGLIVGKKTYGNGIVNSYEKLSLGGSILKDAEHYRISGYPIQGRAVIPDIEYRTYMDNKKIQVNNNKIKPVAFRPYNASLDEVSAMLKQYYLKRDKKNKGLEMFAALKESEAKWKNINKLNIKEARKLRKNYEIALDKFEKRVKLKDVELEEAKLLMIEWLGYMKRS